MKIIKKPLSPNMIWDPEKNKITCEFDSNGELETDDKKLAEKMADLGHTVEGEARGRK